MSVCAIAIERVCLFVSVRDSDESLQHTATGQLENKRLNPSYPFTTNIPRLQPLSRMARIHLGVRLLGNRLINGIIIAAFGRQHSSGEAQNTT